MIRYIYTYENSDPKSYKAHAGVLLLALVFWFMVKMSKDYDYTLEIPLKVTITNEEVCLKYPPPMTSWSSLPGGGSIYCN